MRTQNLILNLSFCKTMTKKICFSRNSFSGMKLRRCCKFLFILTLFFRVENVHACLSTVEKIHRNMEPSYFHNVRNVLPKGKCWSGGRLMLSVILLWLVLIELKSFKGHSNNTWHSLLVTVSRTFFKTK